MKKWIISIFFLLEIGQLAAQDIPVGTWRTHHSYNNARILEATNSKIFCATQNGLFSYDVDEKSLQKISKISGLSGERITAMTYNSSVDLLVLGYESGLVDLIYSDKIYSVRGYQELTENISKEIFDMEIHSGFVYLATNIGILVISLKENAITDNFRSIGLNAQDVSVYNLTQINNQLYIISSEGIQYGQLTKNLLDFNNWERLNLEDHVSFRKLSIINDRVFTIYNDLSIVEITSDTVNLIAGFDEKIETIKPLNNQLGVLFSNQLIQIDLTKTSDNTTVIQSFSSDYQLNDFISAQQLWFADSKKGLLSEQMESLIPNGPISDNISNIELVDGKLFAFYGPSPSEFSGNYDSLGFEVFENGAWSYHEIENFYNLVDVSIYNNNLYFASIGHGIYDSNNELILNENNSILTQSQSGSGILITGIESGKSLWATSFDNSQPLIQLTRDNEWISYGVGDINTSKPLGIDVSVGETLWILRNEGNISQLNIEDETSRTLSTSAGLPSSLVNGVNLDINDEAWVATNAGIVNFSEATYISSDIVGNALIYDDTEVYKELEVSAVASDGGGRVWVAAENQMAVYSNNQLRRYFLFDFENSPLPISKIKKMEYNPANGEMFFLTENGLLSYRSNSSAPNFIHSQVSIFPNPVRPNYTGEVGIKGVVADADIKITDINGKLIQNIGAFGGTASWDLRDYNNRQVKSGVYLVFSTSADGLETFVGKIAVLN